MKISKLFLASILPVLLLSSCGGGGDGKRKVTITYSRSIDTTGATDILIKAFEEKHPNIKIKLLDRPSDTGLQHDLYVTAFNAGSDEIDVLDIDVIWPPEFSQAGYLLPLNRFISRDKFDTAIYNQGALDAARYQGVLWAIPKFIDAGLLFYRKDIVKNPPDSWDELINLAAKYQGQGGTKYGYAMQAKQYEGLVCNAVEFIASYGGRIIDDEGKVVIDSPEAIKGLKKMIEIAGSSFVPGTLNNFTEVESHTAYMQGQLVFLRNWPYQYALANDKEQSKIAGLTGVAALPAGDSGHAAALGGWMTAISSRSRHPQEAWEFVKFVTGSEGQKIFAIHASSAPTIPALFKDKDVLAANPFFGEAGLQNGMISAVARPKAANYQEISDILQVHLSRALAGRESVEEAVANIKTKITEALSDQ